MKRRREGDEFSGKEKNFFVFRHRFVSTGLTFSKLIATCVQYGPITFPTNFIETWTTRHPSTGLKKHRRRCSGRASRS
jgi:hypothetical protein